MLLVSAYYTIPSKQPSAFYDYHIKCFFKLLSHRPIIFFTDAATHERIKSSAGPNVQFVFQEFKDLEVFQTFPKDFWNRQIARDPEKYHTSELVSIWANKKYFVKRAAELDQSHTWYMWVDAGSIRKDSWEPCTREFGSRPLPTTPGVYCQTLSAIPTSKFAFQYPDQFIAGALILFHKDMILSYIESLTEVQKAYDTFLISGSMDQYIMASAALLNASTIKTICFQDQSLSVKACPDAWFFFLALF